MYIGIDIGGTAIKTVSGETGTGESARVSIKTPDNREEFIRALEGIAASPEKGGKIRAIGVGVPGILDAERSRLLAVPNLSFLEGWNIRSFFQRYAEIVEVENDVNCFLLAESRLGSAKGSKNAIGLAIGTGIGGAIMIGGKLYRGANGSAGEFGHTVLQIAHGAQEPVFRTFEKLAAKAAFEEYGDTSEMVGVGVANAINAFDPDIVVLGGGGVGSGAVSMDVVQKTARKYIISPLAKKTPIVKGALGEYAQAVGASLLPEFSSRA